MKTAARAVSRSKSRRGANFRGRSDGSMPIGRIGRARVAAAEAFETTLLPQSALVKNVLREHPQDGDSVAGALKERRRRSLWEVARGHRDFGDLRLHLDELRHDLLIEDEI